MVVYIPSSVASTFTGTSQAAAVSAWLNSNLASGNPPLGFVILTLFQDGSNAEYSVTGTDPLTFSFVLDSGHAANGEPENDSGELETPPAYTAVTSSVTFNLKQLLAITIKQEEDAYQADLGLEKGAGTSSMESYLEKIDASTNPTPIASYITCLPGGILGSQTMCPQPQPR